MKKKNPYCEDHREIKFRMIKYKVGGFVRYNVAESVLDWLLGRKYIDQGMYDAGTKFRKTCERAQIGKLTSCFNIDIYQNKKNSNNDLKETQLDALSSLNKIHKFLGEKSTHFAWLVCVAGYSLQDIKEVFHMKQTYVGERIREVLNELYNYFFMGYKK